MPRVTDALLDAGLGAVLSLFDDGWLDLYTAPQPATGGGAITTQTLLGSLRLGNPAFQAPSGGEAIANAYTPDTSADADGDAVWFRISASDHTTVLIDGSVGTANADLIMNAVSIVMGARIQ